RSRNCPLVGHRAPLRAASSNRAKNACARADTGPDIRSPRTKHALFYQRPPKPLTKFDSQPCGIRGRSLYPLPPPPKVPAVFRYGFTPPVPLADLLNRRLPGQVGVEVHPGAVLNGFLSESAV